MADIVYRLRAFQRGDWTSDTVNEICGEAASEIERLRANQQYTCEEHAGEVRKGGRCVWCELRDVRASLSRAEEAEERVARVKQWAEAYPQDIFLPVTPDDLKRADALLREAGISMSAMHGHWARHIVSGIAKIVGADIAGAITDE